MKDSIYKTLFTVAPLLPSKLWEKTKEGLENMAQANFQSYYFNNLISEEAQETTKPINGH